MFIVADLVSLNKPVEQQNDRCIIISLIFIFILYNNAYTNMYKHGVQFFYAFIIIFHKFVLLQSMQIKRLKPVIECVKQRSIINLIIQELIDILCIFYVFVLSCVCYVFVRVCLYVPCALWSPAGKGLTSWLSFVVSNCEFVTFPLVSWVRCGT